MGSENPLPPGSPAGSCPLRSSVRSCPPGAPPVSQSLRGAAEHQTLISATLLVSTTDTCILWNVSLESQHLILLPNQSSPFQRKKLSPLCATLSPLCSNRCTVVNAGGGGHFVIPSEDVQNVVLGALLVQMKSRQLEATKSYREVRSV